MVILNLTRQSVLARNAFPAAGFRDRLRGLIGRKFSGSMDGMVFGRCNAIHTFFMRYPIDVIFAGEKYRVLKAVPAFPPWRPFLACPKACYVIELPAGTLASSGTETGDQLDLTGALSQEAFKRFPCGKLLEVRQTESCPAEADPDR